MKFKSLSDRLVAVAPSPAPAGGPVETIDDLTRIMRLPRREPLDCTRDPVTRRYAPATQARIEIETERHSRGPRLSCACRPRRVTMGHDGMLYISRVLPDDGPPAPPLCTTAQAFVVDNQANKEEIATGRLVAAMQPGEELELPAADGGAGHPCISMLNAVQAWGLHEARQVGGLVAFAGVGSGKSVLFLLAPMLFSDIRLSVLMIEPKQRRHYKSHYLRLREHFKVSSVVHDDGTGHTVPGTPPLHILSYSVLSRTENSDLLDLRDPDQLLLDEAHKACGKSAINRRVKRYIASKIRKREEARAKGEPVRPRAVRLLDGSGTLESEGVADTQMLCAYSLGMGSPLPLDPEVANRWSLVIDPAYKPDRESKTATALFEAFGDGSFDRNNLNNLFVQPEKAVRRGFQKRRSETLGIISASAADVGSAIYFSERKPPKMPKEVKEALAKVRGGERLDGGGEFDEMMQQIECARNVACGFYTYWAFPKHPCTCPPSQVEGALRCDQCRLIADWYAKRKSYSKEVRSQLLSGEVHLDSEDLCWRAAERFWQDPPYKGKLPTWACESWPAWRDIENKVEHEERVTWISDWLARDAAEWAKENKGVIWFLSVPFGRRVAELAGIPYFNGGPGAEDRMRAEKGNRSICVSIAAHGAGTDGLQFIFTDQLIAETPASNAKNQGYEQLLGRLHREGQSKPVVNTQGYFHVSELKDALRKAIVQAEFNFEMLALKQKILMADLDIEEL